MHVKKDDMVVVLTGDDAQEGRAHKVLRVLPEKGKIVVEGVNRVYKHLRPSQRNQQGGRLSKEMPVDVSNVALFCPNCRRGVRIARRINENGSKERVCKKCDRSLGIIRKAPARQE